MQEVAMTDKDYYLKLDHEHLAWALLQRSALRRLDLMFSEMIEYDMALIRPFLPIEASRIGCGIAAIDARLLQVYPAAEFWLLDRSGLDVRYGREAEHAFYSNMRAAYRMMGRHGALAEQVHLLDAGDDYSIAAERIDVALSLFSWGWHYPLDTYMAAVAEAVRPGGTLIADVRNWEGKEALLEYFDIIGKLKLFDGHRCVFARREDDT
jgi:SAM-dependent methyltransferase